MNYSWDLNSLSIQDGKYLYLSDYHLIINKEFRRQLEDFGGERKLQIKPHGIDQNRLRDNMKNLTQMILEVTQDCTLACKYCVYGEYYPSHRSASKKAMTLSTAKKSIDYIYNIIKDRGKKEFHISFYGGEPLLNFGLIQKIIRHARNKFSHWTLSFNFTTNLTVLSEEMIDFIIENDVHLTVSLDGPRENHDAKRVYHNGSGSFDTVMKNLARIQKRFAEFNQGITFNAVFSKDLSLKKLHEFFANHPLTTQNQVRMSSVDDFENQYYKKYPANIKALKKEVSEIWNTILEKKKNRNLAPIENSFMQPVRMCDTSLKNSHHTTLAGTCLFDSRLYIDAEGWFHPCERINNRFPIGNVECGLDYPRMELLLNQYSRIIETECAQCPVRFLCYRCFSTFAGDGEFTINPEFCRDQLQGIAKELNILVSLKQKGFL